METDKLRVCTSMIYEAWVTIKNKILFRVWRKFLLPAETRKVTSYSTDNDYELSISIMFPSVRIKLF